jgi:CHAT domain-containing protein/tetratricopeptide (TPR) repeat protein
MPPDDSSVTAGEAVYLRGEFDSARALWTSALRRASAAGDSALAARLLTWLGLAAYRQGKYSEARRASTDALALKQRLGLTGELAKSYNALGLLAWNEGRLTEAADLFGQASDAASGTGDLPARAKASNNLALVRTELGDFTRARHGFQAALEAARTLGDARIEGGALSNLAMLDIQTGDPSAAIVKLSEARRLYRTIGYATGEQNALGQLGTAYQALGEPRLALAAIDSSLQLARQQGLRQEVASSLELLAELYRDAGDLRRALQLYAEARAINAELGLSVELGTDLRSEAEIQRALGRSALASRYAAEALVIHERTGARLQALRDHLLLAELSADSGLSREADRRLRTATLLTRRLGIRLARVETALAKARVADRSGRFGEVLTSLAAASRDLAAGGYGIEWNAAMLGARAHAKLGQLDSAVAVGRQAVAAVERVRANFGSGFLRASYVFDKSAPYSDLVNVLLQLGRVEEAFEVADALRGRTLLEHLASTNGDAPSSAPTVRSFAEGEKLLRSINGLVARRDAAEESAPGGDTANAVRIRYLDKAIADGRSAYETLLLKLAEEDAVGSTLLGSRRASAAEIRGALDPHEAILEYLVGANRVWIFVVTRDRVHGIESAVDARELETRARVARELVGQSPQGRNRDLAVLDSLYQMLVGPAVRSGALVGTQRLVVVPHSFLTYLPFAALRNPLTQRYLIEDFSLVELPSAAAFSALRTLRPHASNPDGAAAAAVFAPVPALLPATRREVRSVRGKIRHANAYIDGAATEERVRDALGRPMIVHIATHGTVNVRNPLFSAIELARGSATDHPSRDGRLTVHEVLGLRVRSPMVFLSGCETGLGGGWSTGFAHQEDYGTLAQSFLYAGAGNVVATLWRIEDEGAAMFAERFYGWLRRTAPTEALARAQRDLLRSASRSDPYYWAAYQLSGDGGTHAVEHLSVSIEARAAPPGRLE